MKSLSIATLALVLALSGCSSPPSSEGDTESKVKLIEYELCLETQKDYWKNLNSALTPTMVENLALKACADKRP